MTEDTEEQEDFGAILAAFEAGQDGAAHRADPQVGEMVSGRVLSIGEDMVFVDLGTKSEGAVPVAELKDKGGELTVAVGDTLEALVAANDHEAGYFVLRVRPGEGAASAAELQQAHTHGIPVEGTVKAVTKGGVEVMVGGVRAFCPISQLDIRYVEDAEEYIDQRFSFRIVRFEEGKGRGPNVVLSRRALLEEENRRLAEETRARLEVGSVVKGRVTSLAKYGAFVDLGGLEGLLHISELGYGRVEHPGDVLAEGQEVEVQVLKIEEAKEGEGNERISLSRRALLQDPWQVEAALLGPGTRRPGTVVRIQPFGAFVELSPGVDGLLHISELAVEKHINHPREVVQVGETIEVTVKSVDLERRRISLTLATGAPPDSMEQRSATSSRDSGSAFGSLGHFFDKAKKGS